MRVYLKDGPHIDKTVPAMAFGKIVTDVGVMPYIDVSIEPPFTPVLSEEIMAVVERFSYHANMLLEVANRTTGIYHWKDAKAELTKGYTARDKLQTTIHIEGKSLESISELYTLVCGGLLHPTVSYEAPTLPSLARNIRQLFREIGAVIRRNVIVWWSQKIHR